MFLARIVALIALSWSVTAIDIFHPSQGGGKGQSILKSDDPEFPVPGDNPLQFCESPSEYILEITNVDLKPNPPAAGKTLSIEASGVVHKDIGVGAYVVLQVKYGLITLIRQTVDLCEQVKNVELECPLKAGELTITKDVDLPNEIPPGLYTVLADVYTQDDESITCLTAKIRFSRS